MQAAPSGAGPAGTTAVRDRLLDAAEARIAVVGFAKTTLDDVARAAGLSRATLYRHFAGRGPLVEALVARELDRLDARLARSLASSDDLADAVAEVMVAAAQAVHANPALGTVRELEPDLVAAHLALDALDAVIARGVALVAPHLARFTTADAADRVAAWLVRMFVSYTSSPSPHVDLLDRASVRRLVGTYLAPGFHDLVAPAALAR